MRVSELFAAVNTGPSLSLANGRPCSNFALESTSPPLPFHFLNPPHLKSPKDYGERCNLPSRVRRGATAAVEFCCIVKTSCSISGSLVGIAMSNKMKANPGPGRIRNLLASNRMVALSEIGGPSCSAEHLELAIRSASALKTAE